MTEGRDACEDTLRDQAIVEDWLADWRKSRRRIVRIIAASWFVGALFIVAFGVLTATPPTDHHNTQSKGRDDG